MPTTAAMTALATNEKTSRRVQGQGPSARVPIAGSGTNRAIVANGAAMSAASRTADSTGTTELICRGLPGWSLDKLRGRRASSLG
jgi:hypothetical protein